MPSKSSTSLKPKTKKTEHLSSAILKDRKTSTVFKRMFSMFWFGSSHGLLKNIQFRLSAVVPAHLGLGEGRHLALVFHICSVFSYMHCIWTDKAIFLSSIVIAYFLSQGLDMELGPSGWKYTKCWPNHSATLFHPAQVDTNQKIKKNTKWKIW